MGDVLQSVKLKAFHFSYCPVHLMFPRESHCIMFRQIMEDFGGFVFHMLGLDHNSHIDAEWAVFNRVMEAYENSRHTSTVKVYSSDIYEDEHQLCLGPGYSTEVCWFGGGEIEK